MANRVDIIVRARDEASRIFLGLDRAIGGALTGIGGKVAGLASGLGKAVPQIAAVGSAAITALPALVSAGQGLVALGGAAIAAAPGLLAMGVAGGVVIGTLKAIFAEGRAMREAFTPLAEGIRLAGDNASRAAAQGIAPMVKAFNAQFWPEINHTMTQIGETVNWVAKDFLSWAGSASGLETINGILHPIWQNLNKIAEPTSHLIVSFAQMLGRIMGVSTALGADGLASLFGKLADAMDRVNADTVSNAFAKLGSAWNTTSGIVSKVVEVLGIAWRAYQTYQNEFGALADVLAVVAIAFGGPVTALIAAVGLIVRHFDDLKAAWTSVKTFFTSNPIGTGFMDDLRSAVERVWPSIQNAFNQIKEAVLPVITEIASKIKNDFIPAFGNLISALAPVVAWIVDTMGPMIARTFQNIFNILKGAIDIIIGIFKVLTGVLTGDWSAAWDGIVQILNGAWGIIKAVFDQFKNVITTGLSAAWDIFLAVAKAALDGLLTALENLGAMIQSAFAAAGTWLMAAGTSLINGLWQGIQTAWAAVVAWFTNIGNLIIGFFGPAASWLLAAGMAIIQGLWDGIQLIWTVVATWFTTILTLFLGFFVGAITWLLQTGRDILQGLWDGITEIWNLLAAWFMTVHTLITDFFVGAITWLIQQGRDILQGLWDGIQEIWNTVATWFGTVKSLIEGFFSGAAQWLVQKGKDIIQGLIDGILGMVDEVTGAVGSVIDAAKGALGGAVDTVLGAIPGLASGGVVGALPAAASGRIGSGLTRINERGDELIRLPSGSHVYPAGGSGVKLRRHAGEGGGPLVGELTIIVNGGGNSDEIAEKVREEVEKALAEVAGRIRAGVGKR